LQRKNALIKERQRANRAGGVIDRRFGENDPNLDPEEQMLERFAREKQVQVLQYCSKRTVSEPKFSVV
jgi:nucleolar protein 14